MVSTNPPTDAARLTRLASPLVCGALALGATLALHVRDPHTPYSWGACPTALVGVWCPLCGSLRAVHDLTDLDVVAAASSNLLLVVGLPVVLALWGRRLVACWRGGAAMRPLAVPTWLWVALIATAGAFMVVRNTPAGAWLAP